MLYRGVFPDIFYINIMEIKTRAKILAIDFDGTIVESAYPGIGKLKPGAKRCINMLYDEGYYIIINTCRAGIFEGNVETFLKEVGINYHLINCNKPSSIEYFQRDCRKISADLYIDDKCLMGLPESWEEIYQKIKEKLPL